MEIYKVEEEVLTGADLLVWIDTFVGKVIEHQTALFAYDCISAKPVGFILWQFGENTPFTPISTRWWCRFGFINTVFVHEVYRGAGIGRILYAAAEKRMRESVSEIHLDVYAVNESSQRFHEKLGYEHYASVVSLSNDDWRRRNDDTNIIHCRPYDAFYDRPLLKEGLAAIYSAEGHAQDCEEEAEIEAEADEYLSLFRDTTQIVESPLGHPVAFFSASLTHRCPFGVDYGPEEEPYVFLDYIYCRDTGRGFARAILDLVEQDAMAKNVRRILSGFEICNAKSMTWHLRQGFREWVRLYRKRF